MNVAKSAFLDPDPTLLHPHMHGSAGSSCVAFDFCSTDHIEKNVEHAYNDVARGNYQLDKGVQLKVSQGGVQCTLSLGKGLYELVS